MRYLRYRYTMLYSSGQPRQLGDVLWRAARMTTVMAQSHWHPDTDVSETPTAITASTMMRTNATSVQMVKSIAPCFRSKCD